MTLRGIALIFALTGLFMPVRLLYLCFRGSVSLKDAYLLVSVASFFQTVAATLTQPLSALIPAMLTAVNLWMWWRNGGDDDTKRRWRTLKKKFEPVRRTAPVTA